MILFHTLLLHSQNEKFPDAIHAKINMLDYGYLYDGTARLGQGFEVGYFRNIAQFLNIGVPIKMAVAKLPLTQDNGNTVTTSFDLVFHLENVRESAKVSPYLFGGGGLFLEKFGSPDLHFPFGAGINFRISTYAFINAQAEFRKAMQHDNRDNLQLGIGFVYLLHKPDDLPVLPLDTDGDSIPDLVDHCPDIKGSIVALGCPDRDGDSLGDAEDACPDQKGTLETSGCPDTDKDGVADKDDECPALAGTVRGCPDKDNDGFADKDDGCPTVSGRWYGCPDSDFDGVPDKDDKCPNDPGKVENKGCPQLKDTDGDGFADVDDKCPNEAGPVHGCPDRDGDKFADKDDPCPDLIGEFNGCPDTDKDGLADNLDKCPNSPGPASSYGCPEIKQEAKERLAFATKAVQFETGKAKLTADSYAVLDEIYQILKQYPDYKLAMSGHTDDVGDDETNLALSMERAKTCLDYFIFKGMDANRLRHAGFGETRPIAPNNTAQGRELNRRVEFNLVVD